MKHVLIFSTAYVPHTGGAEIAVMEIAARLKHKYQFSLITYRFRQDLPSRETVDGVRIFRLGWGTKLDRFLLFPFLAFFQARRILHRDGIDLMWAVMVSYAGIGAYLLKLFNPRLPLLLTLQEGDSEKHLSFGKLGLVGLWWRLMIGKADHVQAISSFLARRAQRLGAKNTEVVPNGVDIGKFKAQISNVKSETEQFKIISVSRLVYKNGIDILLRAAAELKALIPNSRFIIQILGSGAREDELKKLAAELKISDRVEFLGEISQTELPKYLAEADIFVRPSRSEGLGISFLEAMAIGLPVIAPNVGGIPDFLKDRETGLFIKSEDPQDLAEKIKQLMADPGLRQRLSENGRLAVRENYDWDKISGRMDNIFQKLSR